MTGADAIGPQLSTAAMAALGLALLLLTGACASPFERPAPVDDGPLRARAVTKANGGIRVSAAVPSADESRSIFGIGLDQRGIQPLWLEIENGSERSFYFLPTGLDPEYFAPLEVAFLYQGPFHDEGKAALSEHLEALSFDSRSPILAREEYTWRYLEAASCRLALNGETLESATSTSSTRFPRCVGYYTTITVILLSD